MVPSFDFNLPPDVTIGMIKRAAGDDSEIVVAHCESCEEEIFDGQDAYRIHDAVWCEDCITQAKFTATR